MRNKLLPLCILLFLSATILPCSASAVTAEMLALACEANVPNSKRDKDYAKYSAFCNTYINGWDDARFAMLQGTRTFCPPSVSVKEMSVVFFDYVATHAEARKSPAAEALMLAFKDKYPCR